MEHANVLSFLCCSQLIIPSSENVPVPPHERSITAVMSFASQKGLGSKEAATANDSKIGLHNLCARWEAKDFVRIRSLFPRLN